MMIQRLSRKIGIDLNHFVKHGPWLLLSDGVQQVSGIVLTLLIARVATQEVLGQFQLALSVMAMVGIVSIRGIDTVIVRDAARKLDGVYKRAIRTRFMWSLLSVPVMVLVAIYYHYINESALAMTFLAVVVLMPWHYTSQSWQSLYKGKELFNKYALSSITRSLLTLLFTSLALFITDGNIVVVILAYVGSHVVVNGATTLKSVFVLKNDKTSSDWKNYSYFLSKAGFFKQIVANIDKILVGVIFSPSVLAIYAISIIIPNGMVMGFKSLFTMVIPKLSNRDYLNFKDLFFALLVGIIMTFATAFLVMLLLIPMFGEKYITALPMALIASLALLFLPLGLLLHNFALMQGKRKVVIVNQLLSPAFKVLLIVLLGSTWKVLGFVVVFALVPLIWSLFALLTLKVDFKKMVVT